MAFKLKNTKMIYKKIVDQIFKDQNERNIEIYVDDLLVKSKIIEQHGWEEHDEMG